MSQHPRGLDDLFDDSANPEIASLLRQLQTSGPPQLRLDANRGTMGFSSTRELLAALLRSLAARELSRAAGTGSLFSPLPALSSARKLREEIHKLLAAAGNAIPGKSREVMLSGVTALGHSGALERAAILLAESRALIPASAFGELVEARLLALRRDFSGAEKSFRRLAQSEEREIAYFARLDLVSLLLESGRIDEARALSSDAKIYGHFGRMPFRHGMACVLLGDLSGGLASFQVVNRKLASNARSARELRLFLVEHSGPLAQLLRRSRDLRERLTGAAPHLFSPAVLAALTRPIPMPPSRLRLAIRRLEEFRVAPSPTEALRRILSFLGADLIAWVSRHSNSGVLQLESIEGESALVEAARKRWDSFLAAESSPGRPMAETLARRKSHTQIAVDARTANAMLAAPATRSQILIPLPGTDEVPGGILLVEGIRLLAPTREDIFFAEEMARRMGGDARVAQTSSTTPASAANAAKLGKVSSATLDAFPDYAKRRFGIPLDLRISGRQLRSLLQDLAVAANSRAPILLMGESGSGKEVLARYAHFESALREGPFIAFNCNAIPSELVESELFGHAKGAFTGAERDRVGLFQVAEGGTLLLDEIGDLKPEVQGKLLRVLQEGNFRRVGETREIRFSGRIVAATHRSLKDLVPKGEFREDLFHRLNRFAFHIPPLRQRRDELLSMTKLLLHRFAEEEGREDLELLPEAEAWIWRQDWPGNVRALENFLYKLALFFPGDSVGEEALVATAKKFDLQFVEKLNPREATKELMQMAIDSVPQFDGKPNHTRAAQLLGWDRATFKSKLAEFGL